jgi:hypothetical protein
VNDFVTDSTDCVNLSQFGVGNHRIGPQTAEQVKGRTWAHRFALQWDENAFKVYPCRHKITQEFRAIIFR